MNLPDNPLESFRRRNPHLYPEVVAQARGAHDRAKIDLVDAGPVALKTYTTNAGLVLTIQGSIRGGKNNLIVTRTGHRFPKKSWAVWRDAKVAEVKKQWGILAPIAVPSNIRLDYIAGDRRRRDMPAIVDSIFHVLEKAGVVEDDVLLWISESSRGYDKENPKAVITFL